MTVFSFVSLLYERVGGREGFLQGGAAEMVLHVWSSSVTRDHARNVYPHISPRAIESGSLGVQFSGWVLMQTFQIC